MPVSAPFGSWPSPFDAESVAAGAHPVDSARWVGDEIWWSERRPTEGGRTGIFARSADGSVRELLPAPDGARSRVHEYGGGAWVATPAQELVYVDAASQRVVRRSPEGRVDALTPEEPGVAYGDLTIQHGRLLAVRETVGDRTVREIVEIPLGAPATSGAAEVRVLAGGSDFTAYPRLSPDGRFLSRLAWDHPQLPWDGTRLEVVEVDVPDATPRVLLGGPSESLVQPEWVDARTLQVLSDRSGFWNPVRVDVDGVLGEGRPERRDAGDALWNLGLTVQSFDPLSGTTLLRTTFGSDRLELLAAGGDRRVVDLPFTWFEIYDRRGDEALVRAGSGSLAGGLWLVDLSAGDAELVRSDLESAPDPDWLPQPEEVTIASSGRDVHAVFFPPRSPTHTGPEAELPPLVALVHGGPTDHTQAAVDLSVAYYTSRGIAVVDVNYGGSTGYGRAYRERLRGQWGVVDVEDVEAVARGLAESGRVDAARLAIEGGSAGGWTVLGALVRGDVFACGVSRYGVADLEALQAATHDFERSYTDGLVGPFAEDPELWRARSPLTDAASLDKPVLLLQGAEDAVVPPAQSEAFRDALVRARVPHAYLLFEGEGHGFRRAETKRRVREAALSFYGQVFGFATDVPELTLWRPDADAGTHTEESS